ncbi:MAG: alpha/beta hydrolase [Angustibacter sp.]
MPVMLGAEPFAHDGGDTGVLLCHGFTGTPQSLRPWATSLAAAGHTVRLPRLPGHGTSWPEMNRTEWPDWFAEVDRALTELVSRCDRVFVGGLSMGGALALRLAQTRPADVAGLMLVNPAVTLGDPRLKALPVLKHVVPSLAGIASDIAQPGSTELAYDRTPLKALHSFVRAMREVARDLPQVTQPLLLMHSPQDHVVPVASSELVLARVSSKDVTEVLLERSFHVATLDHDADVIERDSLAFVQRLTG